MLRYDLHSHSTYSDGLLTPTQLVRRAVERGVDVLALTDHDDVGGLAEARSAVEGTQLRLIDGSELSVSWRDVTLHVIALGIDPACFELCNGLATIREGRTGRARRMADALAIAGIVDAYAGAMKYVTSERLISRSHFARFLVEAGHARDTKDVFTKYLVKGKPGYVSHEWASLRQAIDWIHAAGGQAVLAHPGRYKVDGRELRELLREFRDLGGDGLEVLSSSHTAAQTAEFARHARIYGLRGSCGSDYHGPGESWADLGDMPPLPAGVVPIWRDW
jgi:predicted metal-dependent phosphoesterase TrpH